MKKLLTAAGLAAITLTLAGCGGGDSEPEAEAPTAPASPLDQMLISFNGSPSKSKIQESLDDALNATNTPITDDNYSRAGSVLTTFREEYGVDEMDVLDCIPTAVTDTRATEATFPNIAAVCATDMAEGVR